MSEDLRFEKGCHYFDNSEYFEAHEIWEDVWNECDGARRAFLQCLIQVAVALHHAGNQNWAGSRKLLARSLGYLEKGRPDCSPVDLDALKDRILDFESGIQLFIEGSQTGSQTTLPFFKIPYRSTP